MEAKSILHADMLDILFEGRNKAYGAYELRKTYNKRIIHAVEITVAACLLFFGLSLFAGSKNTTVHQPIVSDVINLSAVDEKRNEEIKPPPVTHSTQQVATRRVTIPIIVKDVDVNPNDKPPANDELDNVRIGLENKDGIMSDAIAPPVEQTTASDINIPSKKEDYEKEAHFVKVEAQFPGGIDAWTKYLRQNLRTDVPVDNGAPEGSYTVVVSFLG